MVTFFRKISKLILRKPKNMVYSDFPDEPEPQVQVAIPLKKLTLVASIAAAIQYGWALQFSLFTPYTQLLGVNHTWVSIIWLCGPVSGLLVQPIVGHLSDHCTSRFGRRRPFIVAGAVLLSVGVLFIGFAADVGRSLGDSLAPGTKKRAIVVLVVGFWLLDISNNMMQGPCRALLADIAEYDDAMVTFGNALFAFFMAVGNIAGYATGAYGQFYRLIPLTKTDACDIYCANLKTCFLVCVLITGLIITLVTVFIKEERLDPMVLEFCRQESVGPEGEKPSLLMQIVIATKSQPREIWVLYAVTALNWIGFFPFLLYDTDWMGKEVYGGMPMGDSAQVALYDQGVRAGSVGLMLYVVTLGAVSLYMEPLVRLFGSVSRLWGIANFILAIAMGLTVVITEMAKSSRDAAVVAEGTSLVAPPFEVTASSFALFTILGIPQAVTYSIPFALASIYSKDGSTGQGLALGLLNLTIVIPQMAVAMVGGPLDSLFGGSNLPSFVLGGIAAAIGGIAAIKMLPDQA